MPQSNRPLSQDELDFIAGAVRQPIRGRSASQVVLDDIAVDPDVTVTNAVPLDAAPVPGDIHTSPDGTWIAMQRASEMLQQVADNNQNPVQWVPMPTQTPEVCIRDSVRQFVEQMRVPGEMIPQGDTSFQRQLQRVAERQQARRTDEALILDMHRRMWAPNPDLRRAAEVVFGDEPSTNTGDNSDITDPEVVPYVPPELDWNQAPDWAQWYAVDQCGDAFWFRSQPNAEVHSWLTHGDARYANAGYLTGMVDRPSWRTMRYQRPQNPAYVPPELDWSTAPYWAQWYAVDRNGYAYWYAEQPHASSGEWATMNSEVGGAGRLMSMRGRPSWRTMIYRRPSTTATTNTVQANTPAQAPMPTPLAPDVSLPRMPVYASWREFYSRHPNIRQDGATELVTLFILPGEGDAATAYIAPTASSTPTADLIFHSGVHFPGVGYDQNMKVFVSELQHLSSQLDLIRQWAMFLGNICAGRESPLPPGVEYRPARTYAQRHNL